MSNREPNEMDEYSEYCDGPEPDTTGLNREHDPDADYDDLMDAEIHEPNLKLDCIAALKQSALKAHSDYCKEHGIKQPDLSQGDGKLEARERLIGYDRNADSYYSNGGR